MDEANLTPIAHTLNPVDRAQIPVAPMAEQVQTPMGELAPMAEQVQSPWEDVAPETEPTQTPSAGTGMKKADVDFLMECLKHAKGAVTVSATSKCSFFHFRTLLSTHPNGAASLTA